MSKYAPTTGEVRRRYAYARSGKPGHKNQGAVAEFDRWLAAHDAEVAAKALEDAADQIDKDFQSLPSWDESYRDGTRTQEWETGGTRMIVDTLDWLRARAAAIGTTNESEDE